MGSQSWENMDMSHEPIVLDIVKLGFNINRFLCSTLRLKSVEFFYFKGMKSGRTRILLNFNPHSGSLNSMFRRCDNKVYFAHQTSASFGYFMRQTSVQEGGSTSCLAPKNHGVATESPSNTRSPCFARPARTRSNLSNSVFHPMARVQGCDFSSLKPPTFARSSKQIRREDQLHSDKIIYYSDGEFNGLQGWMLLNSKADMLSQWKFQVSVSMT